MENSKNMATDFIDRSRILPQISSMTKVVVELGCGPNPRITGAISVDQVDLPGVDIIADVNSGLAFFADASIDEIHSFHFLEHVSDLQFLMSEMHRVLKPGGKIAGTVPHFSNPYYYSDYTHRTPFGLYSFSYFSDNQYFKHRVPTFYNAAKFELASVKIAFASPFKRRNKIKNLLGTVINSNKTFLEFYEENLCYLLPAYEIVFELHKV